MINYPGNGLIAPTRPRLATRLRAALRARFARPAPPVTGRPVRVRQLGLATGKVVRVRIVRPGMKHKIEVKYVP